MSWRDILKAEEKASCGTEKTDDDEPFEKTEAKPDFIDIDGDGNKTESMKEAAKDKKGRKRGTVVPKSKNPFTRKD
jgi:hypothetical protein|tara:strand:+ start:90 stop:317 length:228 start_codon:yes stop_codon:yes gene_type:complete